MNLTVVSFTGLVAFLLVTSNIMKYFIFRWIRHTKNRNLQIKLAYIARFWMKTHRTFGVVSFIIILFHMSLFLSTTNEPFTLKAVSGLIALLLFTSVIISGYFRHQKATGKRRKLHRSSAFLFYLFLLLHVIL